MCLVNDPKEVRRLIKNGKCGKYGLREYIIGYKVVIKHKNYIKSMYKQYGWIPGWNISDSLKTKPCYKDCFIYQGIHVYLSLEKAQNCVRKNRKLMPVKCYISDLIGANSTEAVFSQVYVQPHIFNKLFSKSKKSK